MCPFEDEVYNICSQLESSRTKELQFLCKDLIPQSHNDKQDTHLFMTLKQMGLIDEKNRNLIAELLFYLQRYDLLKDHFKLTKDTMIKRLKNPKMACIAPYRRLLYELGNLVPNSEVNDIKWNFENILTKVTLERVTSLWDLFIELEKKDVINKDNLEYLKLMSQYIDDENFKDRILLYEREYPAASQGSINTDDSPENPTYRTEDSELSSPCYKMNSKILGICLIISNFNFSKARSNPGQQDFNDRRGNKKDEESLHNVFSKLGFEVEIKNDLEGNQILQTINSYRERNHVQNDCFVCCVLSHGDQGIIYGTDGKSVAIRDLTYCFSKSQCPTLIGKPKLFFIQACQGKEHHQLVSLPTDAHNTSITSIVSMDLIPDEPDFLLGMATILYCVSYRHPKNGSWYIQSLCEQLLKSFQSKDDIISTLTKVNHELSQKHADRFNGTQMPQPWTTLTKKLVF